MAMKLVLPQTHFRMEELLRLVNFYRVALKMNFTYLISHWISIDLLFSILRKRFRFTQPSQKLERQREYALLPILVFKCIRRENGISLPGPLNDRTAEDCVRRSGAFSRGWWPHCSNWCNCDRMRIIWNCSWCIWKPAFYLPNMNGFGHSLDAWCIVRWIDGN